MKIALGLLPVALALAFAPHAEHVPGGAEPSVEKPVVGPRKAAPTTGAVAAETADVLVRLLDDPNGPGQIALLPRVYRGDFAVKRSVEILGTEGAVLEGTGHGTVLTIAAKGVTVSDVTLRHSGRRQTVEDAGVRAAGEAIRLVRLSVEDALYGIQLEQCRHCAIENVHIVGLPDATALRGDAIKLWESDDAIVRDCLVEDSRDIVVWYSRRALLEGNYVTRSRYGAHFMYAHDSVVRRMRVIDNVVGIFVMYSSRVHAEQNVLAGASGPAGMGIGFKDSDDATLSQNWLVANTVGTYLDSTPRSPNATVVFDGNVVALNDVGVRLHSSEHNIGFHENDFHENATMVEVEGGGDALGVDFKRNYFSSYEGYDLNGDGTGDVPYQEKILSSALTDGHPALKFFDGTVAMGLIDAASRAVPVLAARTLFVDEEPRLRPRRLAGR